MTRIAWIAKLVAEDQRCLLAHSEADDDVLGREAELLSALTPEQRSTLTTLLRALLDDIRDRMLEGTHVPHVGDAVFERPTDDERADG